MRRHQLFPPRVARPAALLPLLALVLLAGGCGSNDRVQVYPGKKRPPSEVSRVVNAADVVVAMIDNKDPDEPYNINPVPTPLYVYEILPGPHRVAVAYERYERNSVRRSENLATFRYEFEAGKEYSFAVIVVEDRWFPLLIDRQTKKVVAKPEA